MNKDITKYVGIDLGDRMCMMHVLGHDGDFIEEVRVPTTAVAMERIFAGRSKMRIAIEVGVHSRWVSHLLRELGHEVYVADARKLRLIYENPQKSDRVDASYLAKLVRLDISLLAPIRHRGQDAQEHLALLRSRQVLVRTRTQLVNHCRGMVKSFGARLPRSSTHSFARKARSELPGSLRPALEPLLDTIQELSDRIRLYDREIERLCLEVYPETRGMRQIRGIGALTALAYVLTLEDPRRFKKSRQVGPYIGVVPRRNQSGDVDRQGRISKTGDVFLRSLLVGSAHYILGPFGEDSDLRRWGLKIVNRGGQGARNRAAVAVARKLAVLMHALWVSGEDYRPFYSTSIMRSMAEGRAAD